MAIQEGQTILHYRIVDKLGEGGMGQVWRAVDTSLDREVAIKVLPAAVATDAERLARFDREAKLLASLNHPTIASVYGLHADGDTRFLAMEYVPGEDLARRIQTSGALPLDQVLDVGRQIADALAAAHANGIVHRDLKPANVMLAPDGQVKVLDFGLAKAVATEEASGNPSMSPTMTSAGTVAGMILGTASYMSPEQARGRAADKRADLWALGCVLYEMLTGSMVFHGETVSDTLASVLKLDPDWERLPPGTPPALRRLLRRCLEKQPGQRLHDANDARLDVDEAASAPMEEPGALGVPSGERSRLGSPWLLLAVAVLAVVVGVVGGRMLAPSPDEPPVRRFFIPSPYADHLDPRRLTPEISPDGSHVAVIVHGEPFIRRIDRREFRPLEKLTTDRVVALFWAPDSKHLGVATSDELWSVAPDTGEAELICEAPGPVRHVAWGADGTITMVVRDDEIHTVPARGGDPVKIADAEAEGVQDFHGLTAPSDGSGFVVITHLRDNTMRLELRDGNRREDLLTVDARTRLDAPRYARPGWLLYKRGRPNPGLWALRVTAGAAQAKDEPILVLPDVTAASIADDGTLAYVEAGDEEVFEIVWASMDGTVLSTHGEPQEAIRDSSLSPDGQLVVVAAGDDEERDLWLHDMNAATKSRLTFDDGYESLAAWSPDSTTIFYAVTKEGEPSQLYSVAADGSGSPWPLGPGLWPNVSRDGSTLVFTRAEEDTGLDIYRRALGDTPGDAGEPQVVLNGEADEHRPALSPDGRWLAYVSNETGRREVYITSFPDGQGRWQISFDGGEDPTWSAEGDALHFEWSRRLYRVEIAERGSGLSVSSPGLVLNGNDHALHPWYGFHVSEDGSRLLTVREVRDDSVDRPPVGIHVVENWVRAFGR